MRGKEAPTAGCATPRKASPSGAPRFVAEMEQNRPTLAAAHAEVPAQQAARAGDITVGNGDVLIAAITSCTNTSNPSVMLAAGLLAKKAVEAGLKVKPTSRHRWRPARASSPNTSRKPACCLIWKSWVLRWRATAAPPALATRATSRPSSTTPSPATTWCAPPCCRATATSRRASTPT